MNLHLGNIWQPFVSMAISALESAGQSMELSTDPKKHLLGVALEEGGKILQGILDFANGKADKLPDAVSPDA